MRNASDDLVARDMRVLWHPATHFRDLETTPPIAVRSAQGCWLEDVEGRRILDAISSWWTSVHGHGHPRIVEAVRRQAAQLDHVMFAGFTHEPAVRLAERLLELAPPGYGKVFYADCGSASIEVALKLSFQSRIQRGESGRTRFATLTNAYHGETLGALAVGGTATYREPFQPMLQEVLTLPVPRPPQHEHADLEGDLSAQAPETERAVAMLTEHAHELTALVIEPLIQCAGKMNMYGVGAYRRLVQVAQSLGIHVIADEIAVAFGRTGRLFASEWAEVSPDLLCVSKGLSGGVLPLAATLIRAGFEDDFKGAPSRSFMHSHTFTGNPVACAAGLASLEGLAEDGVLEALPRKIDRITRLRRELGAAHPAIVAHRQAGMVAALRVEVPAERMPAGDRLGLALREAALRRGVLLRPLHDTIYWMPPLVVSDAELDRIAEVTAEVIGEVAG